MESAAPAIQTPPSERPSDVSKRKLARYLLALATAITIFAELWFISAGRFVAWPQYGTYYDQLTRGFALGQTNIPKTVPPGLLALRDPFNPNDNARYRIEGGLHDMSLYGGKLYLYWGPFPAIVMLLVRRIFGIAGVVGDQYPAFVASVGLTLAAGTFAYRAWSRSLAQLPAWTGAAGAIAVSLMTPLPYCLARASVYESSIIGGQCCLIAGLAIALWIVTAPRPNALMFFLLGVAWSAAVATRVSLSLAVVGAAIVTLWYASNRETVNVWARLRGLRVSWIVALTVPSLCSAAALGYYNQVRFGSPLEIGVKYQLAGANFHAMATAGKLTSLRETPMNVARYLFEPPRYAMRLFPFTSPFGTWVSGVLFHGISRGYVYDPVASIVIAEPILSLAAVGAWVLVRRPVPRKVHDDDPLVKTPSTIRRPCRWIVASLSVVAILGLAPDLLLHGSSLRYLMDGVPALTLLAVFAAGWIWTYPSRRHREARELLLVIASVTLYHQLAFGFTGDGGRQFIHNNPRVIWELSPAAWDVPPPPDWRELERRRAANGGG